jgi:hypothetical protein
MNSKGHHGDVWGSGGKDPGNQQTGSRMDPGPLWRTELRKLLSAVGREQEVLGVAAHSPSLRY